MEKKTVYNPKTIIIKNYKNQEKSKNQNQMK